MGVATVFVGSFLMDLCIGNCNIQGVGWFGAVGLGKVIQVDHPNATSHSDLGTGAE